MDFALSENQQSIRDAVQKVCSGFNDAYWLKKDREGGFPSEFHRAMADGGWLGICVPEKFGGVGLGVTEAAIIMRAVSESGAGMSGASAIHMNIFGLNPVIVFGTDEQRARMLPPMIEGKEKSCFGVTEPNTGLNTTQLKLRAERRGDRYVVNGQKVWISTASASRCTRSRRWAARPSTPTNCFSRILKFRWRTASARRGGASTTSWRA